MANVILGSLYLPFVLFETTRPEMSKTPVFFSGLYVGFLLLQLNWWIWYCVPCLPYICKYTKMFKIILQKNVLWHIFFYIFKRHIACDHLLLFIHEFISHIQITWHDFHGNVVLLCGPVIHWKLITARSKAVVKDICLEYLEAWRPYLNWSWRLFQGAPWGVSYGQHQWNGLSPCWCRGNPDLQLSSQKSFYVL